jgi:hypothetical protein
VYFGLEAAAGPTSVMTAAFTEEPELRQKGTVAQLLAYCRQEGLCIRWQYVSSSLGNMWQPEHVSRACAVVEAAAAAEAEAEKTGEHPQTA